MDNFQQIKTKLQQQIERMLLTSKLFVVDLDKDLLWQLYLESFRPEDNAIFRERRAHDCNCCKTFIRRFGGVVAINSDYSFTTMWDIDVKGSVFERSFKAMTNAIIDSSISDIFLTKEVHLGSDRTPDTHTDISWNHFYYKTPAEYLNRSSRSNEDILGEHRTRKETLKRALDELTEESVNIVLELIDQNNLHRGQESRGIVAEFKRLQKQYLILLTDSSENEENNFAWLASTEVSPALCGIRNSSIGTLLVDLSEGRDINDAVGAYEEKVAGANYKRPKPIFTARMREQAQEKIENMGFGQSLYRRFATIGDITSNNILFVDRTQQSQLLDANPFNALARKQTEKKPSLEGAREITIEEFIEKVLPKVTSMSVLMENHLESNLVSLIAPVYVDSKSMFKWNNNFSWAYKGNVATSMRERVKTAGGSVTGDLRFSIQWDHNDDLDAHCSLPKGYICYRNKRNHDTGGELDVDIIYPSLDPRVRDGIAVENITFPDRHKLKVGDYNFLVNCYSSRDARTGFSAEIEYDGQIHQFHYAPPLRTTENVPIAIVKWDGSKFTIKPALKSGTNTKEVWNIKTNSFVPVTVMMYSPNYWDGQGIGNKQYMFMLSDCRNDETPNGFYNEFLCQELSSERKVMEALGGIMKVAETENQLSGLGFSATKRAELTVKVEGAFNRILKIKF